MGLGDDFPNNENEETLGEFDEKRVVTVSPCAHLYLGCDLLIDVSFFLLVIFILYLPNDKESICRFCFCFKCHIMSALNFTMSRVYKQSKTFFMLSSRVPFLYI